jgi:hypothetical protein
MLTKHRIARMAAVGHEQPFIALLWLSLSISVDPKMTRQALSLPLDLLVHLKSHVPARSVDAAAGEQA